MAIVVGLLIGLVLGLTGAGGSLFAVPLLSMVLLLPLVDSTGIALGAVAISALFGVLQRDRSEIAWLPALIILITGAFFAPLGRWLAGHIDDSLLLGLFSILMVWVAVKMWRQARLAPDDTRIVRAKRWQQSEEIVEPYCRQQQGRWTLSSRCLLVATLGGATAGFLSGLLGVGGGFVVVPLLTLVAGLSMSQAVATSLFIITGISAVGFASHYWLVAPVDTELLLQVALGGILGMALGVRLGDRITGPVLQRSFAITLVVMLLVLWVTHVGEVV
ncbi:MAG: sulfite exporter TauE/SafE family protein [Candidatus Pelagadaptatus aseana]|uniref:sulfite exporter TauE/SafE family protein n=1 Tax=Candidatus Pelagadaptatus aseana TaxID=3120508 RepID=UPI0039B16816